MSKAAGTALKAAGIITVLTLLSRVMGLLRKLAQSAAMSAGAVATAYDTANTVPNVLFEVAAGGALAGAVIPLISGFLAQHMQREASETASALITWVLLIGVPVAVIVAGAAAPISRALFGVGTDPEIVTLATTLLRMMAIQIPLYGLSVVFTGILQAHKKFVLPALAPLLSSIVVIGVFVLYAAMHGPDAQPGALDFAAIAWLGWGTTAGVVVFSLPQLIPAARLLHLRPRLRFPAGVAKRTLRLAGAGLGALLAQQIAIIAIMVVANMRGGVGAYNTFNYAWAMFMVPYAVLAVPIATVTFPRIASAVSVRDRAHASDLIAKSTRLVVAMGITAAAMLVVLARPAQIVLEMGRTIAGLDAAMMAMALGVAGYSMMYHGARVLYALERGKWVILTNSLGWGTVVAGLVIAAVAGGPRGEGAGRLYAVSAIGFSMSVGLSVGAMAIVLAIAHTAGRAAVRGVGRSVAIMGITQAGFALPAWWTVQALLGVLGAGFAGAIVSAVVGAVILAAGAGGALWFFDRGALQALR